LARAVWRVALRLDSDGLAVGTWLDRVERSLDDQRLLLARITSAVQRHDLRTAIRRIYAPGGDCRASSRHGRRGAAIDADEIPLDDLLHLANGRGRSRNLCSSRRSTRARRSISRDIRTDCAFTPPLTVSAGAVTTTALDGRDHQPAQDHGRLDIAERAPGMGAFV
jgi:hypothetical protein